MRYHFKSMPAKLALIISVTVSAIGVLVFSLPVNADPALRTATFPEREMTAAETQDVGRIAGGEAAGISKSDPYADWSRRKLQNENAGRAPHHPLAENHPNEFAVVCEAGCSSGRVGVVDLTPRKPPMTLTGEGELPMEFARDAVVCVGGCYADAGPQVASVTSEDAHEAMNWLTTVKPDADKPAAQTGGHWYDRIGGPEPR